MATWREDFNAWKELYNSFDAHSLESLSTLLGEEAISSNPNFNLKVVQSPLSDEDRISLEGKVREFWNRASEKEGWRNRFLYGNFGTQNIRVENGAVVVEVWPVDYATSRFKNRPDEPTEWQGLNSAQKEYLEKLQLPGIIVVTKLAGEDLYLLSSRIDRGRSGPRRRDQLLEAPQGLISRDGKGDPVKNYINTLLKDEANTLPSSVLGIELKGYHQSSKYGDTAFVFKVEINPAAEWHALQHPEKGGHYARQWLSADRINAMPPNHINPAVYSALKLAGVISKD